MTRVRRTHNGKPIQGTIPGLDPTATPQAVRKTMMEMIEAIAQQELLLPDLRERGDDRSDFYECHITSIKLAMVKSYLAGRASR